LIRPRIMSSKRFRSCSIRLTMVLFENDECSMVNDEWNCSPAEAPYARRPFNIKHSPFNIFRR
jgi:hypothetical protein